MSLPILVLNPTVLDAEDMSENIESTPLDVGETGGFAVHSDFSGAPGGSLVVSVSNDLDMTFIPIDTYAVTTEGSRLLNVESARWKYVKVTYTKTSGTGALTTRISGKQI